MIIYQPMPIKGLDSCCVRALAIEGVSGILLMKNVIDILEDLIAISSINPMGSNNSAPDLCRGVRSQ